MKRTAHILFVEDDPNLSILVNDFLGLSGYDVTHAGDGEAGLRLFGEISFDMVIIDIMLPRMDGFQLAAEIRDRDSHIPIIYLTARSMREDRIKGLKTGADDYITKPFSTEELGLRIEAILKRSMAGDPGPPTAEQFGIGSFVFDYTNLELCHDTGNRRLTRKEAELLHLLVKYRNNLLTREHALRSIWGDDDYFSGRSMDVFITKLRKYLKPDDNISIINIHGSGFRLEVPE